jgi:ribonuclease-3
LCCAFEAVLGAVYLEGGLDAADAVVRPLLEPLLDQRSLGERDAKTRVQELVQSLGQGAPRYTVVEQEGPEHARVFHVVCSTDTGELGRGAGRSKLEAEQRAARAALEALSPTPEAGV